jgi:hypothetical protein
MFLRVRSKKPEHDRFVTALVRFLIEQIAPVGERIVGRRCSTTGIRPTFGQGGMCRFGHGKALGGELGVRAVHEIFSFWLNLVFGMDGVYVIVHPSTVKDKKTVRGIGSSK